ncbi:3-hydroxyacyl-CoA dehydrogenase/enoyl-CoA hydratase family protein [Vulcanisaeta souniana]|uniref:3-hydroxyacyl-CoA dehydrogenase n=1 Tax=Vulcanisaeta souniana JCM 11219 TaxID=1293586 RepID=A0A830EH05_9CREN|nr:3-hydroxyacyl-CoA dehydrogenase/enoyl-CoA hydratase family protein [Vulcanisaeta souniana]BDR92467.1 3-hydroxyacyl-CoA dehydrogenase [Vulcanisaeta souniana JCM 11219]GGI75736.1 3-hydroxyacyl-CoA dehydrogenase [Vulcanisaeta souniana JCM 11219]
MSTKIRKVAVIGSGTMGHGIAEVTALAGYEVVMVDVAQDLLNKALERIKWSLDKLAERGTISKEKVSEVMGRIKTSLSVTEAVKDIDLMIEAVPENIDLKKKIFSEADANAPSHAILATNTSSLPITEIASATKRPERVVGIHFFNPPVLMPLVEVIKGAQTNDEVAKRAYDFVKSLGKEPIMVNKDVPGFVVNRILVALNSAACLLVTNNVYSIVEIDSAVKYRAGLPMGIFELQDFTGVDVGYLVGFAVAVRDPMLRVPCPLIEELYKKGWLGQKSGRGFYEYKGGPYERANIPREAGEKVDLVLIFAPAINMAAWLLREGIASREDIDKGVKMGLGWPKGVLEYADEFGIDKVVEALNQLYSKYNYDLFKPDPLLTQMVQEGRLGQKSGKGFYDYGATGVTEFKEIILKREPPLAWIILNRPHRLNTLTMTMLDEVSKALDMLWDDKEVRVVIIRGAGDRAFSAGADVTSFQGPLHTYYFFVYNRKFQEAVSKIERFPKPVIAAIDGYALGGGLETAMACDFRIATDRSELGQPEINLGIIPGAGGTQRLIRYVGLGRAKELIMLGDRIKADEAYRIGLVNKVVPREKFEDEVRSFALRLAQGPPVALTYAKYAVNFGTQVPVDIGLMLEAAFFSMAVNTKDAQEGVMAFAMRRRPEFKGE